MSFYFLPGCPVLRKIQIFIPRRLLRLLLMVPHGPRPIVPMSAGVSSSMVQTLEGEEGPREGRRISPGVAARAEPGADVKHEFSLWEMGKNPSGRRLRGDPLAVRVPWHRAGPQDSPSPGPAAAPSAPRGSDCRGPSRAADPGLPSAVWSRDPPLDGSKTCGNGRAHAWGRGAGHGPQGWHDSLSPSGHRADRRPLAAGR